MSFFEVEYLLSGYGREGRRGGEREREREREGEGETEAAFLRERWKKECFFQDRKRK